MDAHARTGASWTGGAMIDEARAWVPPIPLALGILSIALSWGLVLVYANTLSFGVALAWIHVLALGGFTTIALAVLIHAVPSFTDLPWRGKPAARIAGVIVPCGALGLAASFALQSTLGVGIFAVITASAIGVYAAVALVTLSQRTQDRTDAAIARALWLVIFMLVCTAAFGVVLGIAYATGNAAALHVAPAHAALGIVGWLTLLTMGVSANTFRPLLGTSSRSRVLHIASNGGMGGAAILAPLGLLFSPSLFTAACVIGIVAAFAYAADSFDRLLRASTPHRPVHAFVAAAMLWLVAAAALLLAGDGASAIVAALAGWILSMVYAHLHHIAVRVLATIVLGANDQTPPWKLLNPALSWATFALTQLAAIFLLVGTHENAPALTQGAGAAGLAALACYGLNAIIAVRTAKALPVNLL
jgi:hypothetical protein